MTVLRLWDSVLIFRAEGQFDDGPAHHVILNLTLGIFSLFIS